MVPFPTLLVYMYRGGCTIFERGGGGSNLLGLHAKGGGVSFVPNVKKPTSWAKAGGGGVQTPGPPGSATDMYPLLKKVQFID